MLSIKNFFSIILLFFIMTPILAAENNKSIKIGVLSYRSQEMAREQWQPTADHIQRQLPGYNVVLMPLYFSDLNRMLESGVLDFVLTNPEHYVLHRSKLGMSAIATLMPLSNGHPLSEFGGVIFTKSNRDDIVDLNDLKNKKIASPGKESFAGYLTQMWLLAKNQVEEKDLSIKFTGMPHDLAVYDVMSEKVDVGFIRTGILESMIAEKKISQESIKILNNQTINGFDLYLSTDLYPEWPFVACKNASPDVIKKVSHILLSIESSSSVAKKGNYFGFAPPADYTSVEAVMQRLRVHPDFYSEFDFQDVVKKYGAYLDLIAIVLFLIAISVGVVIFLDKRKIATNNKEKETLLASIEEGLYGVDKNGKCTFINRAALEILNCEEEDAVGKNQHELFHNHYENGDQYPQDLCPINMTIKDGRVRRCEETFYTLDNRSVPVEIVVSPIYSDKKIIGAMVAFRDISEKKKQQQNIQEQKNLFELIIESVQDGIFVVDSENDIIYVNKSMCNIAGIKKDELIGKNLVFDFAHNTNSEFLNYYYDAVESLTPVYFNIHLITPSGRDAWQKGWIVPKLKNNSKFDGAVSIVNDYTSEKKTKQEMDEMARHIAVSEERLKFALDSARDGVWDWDIVNNTVFYSSGWKRSLGYGDNEISDSLAEWESRIHPDDVEETLAQLNNHINGVAKIYSSEHRIKCKDGSYKWILDRGVIVDRDESGKAIRMVGSNTDISDRKRIEHELKDLNETLEQKVNNKTMILLEQERLLAQQSKLATMGEMISNIAHQWRQPLNSLALKIQYIPMAVEFGELDEQFATNFEEEGMEYIRYMSQTIDDFRNFFKPDKQKTELCVKDAVYRAYKLVGDSLHSAYVKVNIDIEDVDLNVMGYPNEFSQVLLNILNNAKDALVEKRSDNRNILIKVTSIVEGVNISICDNAGGIPDSIIDKIFEPYFTTKHQAQGTGLGLYMSKVIIEQNMHGVLSVKNSSLGACFEITLPLC